MKPGYNKGRGNLTVQIIYDPIGNHPPIYFYPSQGKKKDVIVPDQQNKCSNQYNLQPPTPITNVPTFLPIDFDSFFHKQTESAPLLSNPIDQLSKMMVDIDFFRPMPVNENSLHNLSSSFLFGASKKEVSV